MEIINLKSNNSIKMKGVLIHGSSGIGKSLMIREVLSEVKAPTIIIEPKDLVGEEDKFQKIRNVFKIARSKEEQLSVIWIEEIEFICS